MGERNLKKAIGLVRVGNDNIWMHGIRIIPVLNISLYARWYIRFVFRVSMHAGTFIAIVYHGRRKVGLAVGHEKRKDLYVLIPQPEPSRLSRKNLIPINIVLVGLCRGAWG